jgi:hypothetical protein
MNLEYPFSMIVTGMPGAGKTALIKYIFLVNSKKYTKDPFKYGVVFTHSKQDNEYSFLPQKYVHPSYSSSILQEFIKLQKDEKKKHGKAPKAFLVFDDCLDRRAFMSTLFIELVTTYRHLNINIIITAQYLKILTTAMREACRYAVLMKQTTDMSITASFTNFGYGFNNLKEFRDFLIKSTMDHGAVFIDRKAKKIEDIYTVIRVPDPGKMPKFTYKF